MNPDSRLLHLPQSSRYAVSATLYLAASPPDKYQMVRKIAEHSGLSVSYLAKILQQLALRGILDSRRGVKGGYRLSRPAVEILLSEIVAASHGLEPSPMPCMIEAKDCDTNKPCALHESVASTEAAMWSRLSGTTLENLNKSSFKHGELK